MHALLCKLAIFHHINTVRFDNIRQSVRDQNDRLCLRKLPNHIHDHLFALDVDIARRLIEDIHRRIMKKRPCKPKSLFLSAGQISRLLLKLCLKSILRIKKRYQVHASKHGPHLCLGRIRLRHPKVFFDRPFKQVTVVSNQRHILHQGFLRDIPNRNAADRHFSTKSTILSG